MLRSAYHTLDAYYWSQMLPVALVALTQFALCLAVCLSSSFVSASPLSSPFLLLSILLPFPSAPLLIFLHLPPLPASPFCFCSNSASSSVAALFSLSRIPSLLPPPPPPPRVSLGDTCRRGRGSYSWRLWRRNSESSSGAVQVFARHPSTLARLWISWIID